MQKQPLTYDEFFEQLWGNIPGTIVSEEYLNRNIDFIQTITFDYYRLYEMDEDLKLPTIRRMVESTFFALFRLNPS